MRIQPRQQTLDIWRSMLMSCYGDKAWTWGGRDGSNAISDAEQLLCLLYPATEIQSFPLDRPDDMPDDMKSALDLLGEEAQIPRTIVGVLEDYIGRYTAEDGQPIFSAGGYLRTGDEKLDATAEQLALDVVDSYSMSLTLCLAARGFLKVFQRFVKAQTRREAQELSTRIDILYDQVGVRLTAAMTGLVRSFVVNTIDRDSESRRVVLGMLNQTDAPESVVIESLSRRLERIRLRLRNDVTLGQVEDTNLDDDRLLFECGWSWGIVKDSAPIGFVDTAIGHQPGVADARPYLYFTVVALDGINDLRSERTRELDILDEEQSRLADALQIRWDVTQRYWATVARFGNGRWPLEDIPWRTSDGEESDYFSLVVSAVLMQDLVNRQATDDDLTRAVAVFEELARRGRIIRRVTRNDPAVEFHVPGVRLTLRGTDKLGPQLYWVVSDYAPLLLKRVLQAAQLSNNVGARDRLIALAESTMDHLDSRTIREGPSTGLWDDPSPVFGADTAHVARRGPSWYTTERVIECLITADRTYREPPLRTDAMSNRAVELLNEADHLLNQEMLEVSDDDVSSNRKELTRIEQRLNRARRILGERPGTSFILAGDALLGLEELAYARSDAARSV
jgi:hypothetical protein